MEENVQKRKRGRPRKSLDKKITEKLKTKKRKISLEEIDLFTIPYKKLTFNKMLDQLCVLYPDKVELLNTYAPTVKSHKHLDLDEKRFVLEYLINPETKLNFEKTFHE